MATPTGLSPAEALIRHRAAAAGSVGVDEFLNLALYDPAAGFYFRGGGAGRRHDFLTSPEVGPLFGAVVAGALDGWWDDLGRPPRFVVVEAGAGRGALARSILAADPACRRAGALALVLVEVSPVLRAAAPAGAECRATMPAAAEIGAADVVLANELLDNLAFRLAERTTDGWREVRLVATDRPPGGGGALAETLAPLAPADEQRSRRLAPGARPGARIPLQDRAAGWLREALDLAAGGRLVVVDYAADTAALAARPWTEWVRTYAGHGPGGPPWEHAGAQDVTCEVAVDQLAAVRAPSSDRSQADWLRAHGLDALVAEGQRIWAERAGIGDLAAVRARSRVGEARALTAVPGLGGFRVLEWTA